MDERKPGRRYNGRRRVYIRWCEHCPRSFESIRSDARYCSARCRQAVSRERRGKAALAAILGMQAQNKKGGKK